MQGQSDRRLLLALGGGGLVLVVSLGLAFVLIHHGRASNRPPPASVGGLVVQMGAPQDAKLDPQQQLRCFVNGQFIGMASLADCAKRNGVATDAVDTGVDTGGLSGANPVDGDGAGAASDGAAADQSQAAVQAQAPVDPSAAALHGLTGECLAYGGAGWRKLGDGLSLSACVQALFAGHCVRAAGGASYGRWANQTLRLEPHRVEGSADNVNFHPVVEQSDTTCGFPDF